MSDEDLSGSPRVRREPPPLLPVSVLAHEELSPRTIRVTFGGDAITTFETPGIAASVRLLVPSPGADALVMPTWNGNEFLLPDRQRPSLRTFTPLRFDAEGGRLEIEIVRHPGGVVSEWAERVTLGAAAAISGPGRGYEIDPDAPRFLILGDETALPAIGQLVGALAPQVIVDVHVEVVSVEAVVALADQPGMRVHRHVSAAGAEPGASLVTAALAVDGVDPSTRIWAAGEAASMQAIRKHLFGVAGATRGQATIRGYWKVARR